MRKPPTEFTRGPKPTRDKLNALVRAVRENKLIPGIGLRIRETDKGLLVTLDDKVLLASGLANSSQAGRGPENGGPFGSTPGLDDFAPPDSDPTPPNPDPQPEPPDGVTPPGEGDDNLGDAYPPLRWATFTLPDAELEASYSASLFAVGGNGTYSYAVTGGSLPPGLSLSGNTISGTPTTLGSYSVEITVSSAGKSVPNTFALMVSATGSVKIIGTDNMGTVYWLAPAGNSTTLSVVGGVAPFAVFFTQGALGSWYNAAFNGSNVTRPSSMAYFPTSSIYGEGISVTISPNASAAASLRVLSWPASTREVYMSPQGPRRWTLYAFDSNGASYSKTVTCFFAWDTTKYVACATGPDQSQTIRYPRWVDKSAYDANPSAYTLFTGTLPTVT